MAAGAERETRIEFEDERVGIGRVVPRRHDPDALADRNRIELRLREPHPVLFLDVAHGERRRLRQPDFIDRRGKQHGGIGVFGEQRHDARALPRAVLGRETGLAEERLLVGRIGVGVFHRYRQRADFQQRVRQRFRVLAIQLGDQFPVTHRLKPLRRQRLPVARRACFRGSECSCRLRRTSRRSSSRDAAGCWSKCLPRPSPTARCACG